MGSRATTTQFGGWLSGRLDERGWGVRTLARNMNPSQPEVARRALNRYLYEGAQPSTENRSAIADALGVAPDEMPSSDDEEEHQTVSLADVLKREIRQALREEREALREELAAAES